MAPCAHAADDGAFLSIVMTAALAGLAMRMFRPPQGAHGANAAGAAWFAASGLLTVFTGRVFLSASVHLAGATGSGPAC